MASLLMLPGSAPAPLVLQAGGSDAAASWSEASRPDAADAIPGKVGEAGDVDLIGFEGVQTFTPAQIRLGLNLKPGYLLVAHPQADLLRFMSELQGMVQTGYQAAGFPEARAEVRYDTTRHQLRVQVSEGERFQSGKIHVSGLNLASEKELRRWLTTPARWTQFRPVIETLPGTMAAEPSEMKSLDRTERAQEATWVSGEPANFSEVWLTQAVAQVEACLADQGFFFARANAELRRDDRANSVDLMIRVEHEGAAGVIGDIRVNGLTRDTPEELLRFLHLRKGDRVNTRRLTEIRQKLWVCARYRDFEVWPEIMEADAGVTHHVKLTLQIKELEGAPRLTGRLSPVQDAVLQLGRWLEEFPRRHEDIRATIRDAGQVPFAVEAIISPTHGLLLDSADLEGRALVSAGLIYTPQKAEFAAWATGRKLAGEGPNSALFSAHLAPNREEGPSRFDLSLGAGFSSRINDGEQRTTGTVLNFDIQLMPAAFLDLTLGTNPSARLEGRRLCISNSYCIVQADAATGRVLSVAQSDTNGPQLTVEFGTRAWSASARAFSLRAAPLQNLYAPDRLAGSFLTLTLTELLRAGLIADTHATTSPGQRATALRAIHKLLRPELFTTVDHFFQSGETNAFMVPWNAAEQDMMRNDLGSMFLGAIFEVSNDLFPKRSWPWTAARESALVLSRRGLYTGEELERLADSEDTGPVGCLVLASTLGRVDAGIAKNFALLGLVRLDEEHFLRDCNLFLQGESGLARAFAQAAGTLRNLPDDELTALGSLLPASEAQLLLECAAALRAQPEVAPAAALSPALANYWRESLRVRVRNQLRATTTSTSTRD